MNTKFPLSGTVQLAFDSAFLVLLVVGVMSYRSVAVSGAGDSDRWGRHTEVSELQNQSLRESWWRL